MRHHQQQLLRERPIVMIMVMPTMTHLQLLQLVLCALQVVGGLSQLALERLDLLQHQRVPGRGASNEERLAQAKLHPAAPTPHDSSNNRSVTQRLTHWMLALTQDASGAAARLTRLMVACSKEASLCFRIFSTALRMPWLMRRASNARISSLTPRLPRNWRTRGEGQGGGVTGLRLHHPTLWLNLSERRTNPIVVATCTPRPFPSSRHRCATGARDNHPPSAERHSA